MPIKIVLGGLLQFREQLKIGQLSRHRTSALALTSRGRLPVRRITSQVKVQNISRSIAPGTATRRETPVQLAFDQYSLSDMAWTCGIGDGPGQCERALCDGRLSCGSESGSGEFGLTAHRAVTGQYRFESLRSSSG
jgi:hypothetical protein